MSHHIRWLVFIVLLSAFALWVSLPDTQSVVLDSNNDGEIDFRLNIQQSLGLDLVGGLRVLLKADLPPGSYTGEDLQETANNVARRVNALGVTEPTIQVLQGSGRILVELPGVTDPQQAIEAIQQTALLEFVDFSGINNVQQYVGHKVLTTEQVIIQEQRAAAAAESTVEPSAEATAEAAPQTEVGLPNPNTNQPFKTVITGAGLQAAAAELSQGTSWHIRFELTPEGGRVFGPFTAANIGQPMAIVLDGIVLSAPTIQAELPTGGVITGNFTEKEAKTLALQLRSGALPIPLSVESNERVGATLGQESVNRSIRAGVIGVIVVLTFMLVYYRVPGIAADLALLVFILLNMAIFKLVPVTLTLPAIVGFLISIGTAVDGNILIFERIKEELRAGKDLDTALVSGFDRAWNSIRDSNFSTIIICGILFLFGQTPGASIVSGFAITLALGLVINLFTAIIVTRTFLHILVALFHQPLVERKWLLGV
jgi:protein-export membrane protein SecD